METERRLAPKQSGNILLSNLGKGKDDMGLEILLVLMFSF